MKYIIITLKIQMMVNIKIKMSNKQEEFMNLI